MTKTHEELEKEAMLYLWVMGISALVIAICSSSAKFLGENSGFLFFILCLTLTLFWCVVLYKHRIPELNPFHKTTSYL